LTRGPICKWPAFKMPVLQPRKSCIMGAW